MHSKRVTPNNGLRSENVSTVFDSISIDLRIFSEFLVKFTFVFTIFLFLRYYFKNKILNYYRLHRRSNSSLTRLRLRVK